MIARHVGIKIEWWSRRYPGYGLFGFFLHRGRREFFDLDVNLRESMSSLY